MTALECRRLDIEWKQGLAEFCSGLEVAGETEFFYPHRFCEDEFDRLARYQGLDLHYVMVEGSKVLGYGLLRGWEEGYAIPSLGIAIDRSARSHGLGTALMHFLHAAARRRGAAKVRLRVHVDNARAISLYQRLGYTFDASQTPYLVGFKELADLGRDSIREL